MKTDGPRGNTAAPRRARRWCGSRSGIRPPERRPTRVPSVLGLPSVRARWVAAAVASTVLGAGGCYDHHLRGDEGSSCGSPHIIGPESGRAGAPCDDCGGSYSGHPGPFVVRGDVGYRHAHDLEIIDLSIPRDPVVVGHVATVSPRAGSLALTDRALVVGGAFAEVYDLSDPLAPRYVGSLLGASVGFTVAARGDAVVVASPNSDGLTLRTFDLRDPSAPVALWTLDVSSDSGRVHVAMGDGVVWLVRASSDDRAELVGIDASTEARAPVIVSETVLAEPPRGGEVSGLSLAGTGLLLCGSLGEVDGLAISSRYFDVTTSSPLLRAAQSTDACGLLVTPRYSVAVTRRDARGARGSIALFDVTTPVVPIELGRAPHPSDIGDGAIVGDALLVSGTEGLIAFPLGCD